MVPPDCTAANPLTCVDRAAYLHDMFLASDTTVALLSDLPSTGESNDPLPFSAADDTWQLASSLTRGGRAGSCCRTWWRPTSGRWPNASTA
jgi:hypothetical protein